jgi:hypothetical protein
MSYVPPHARNASRNASSNNKISNTKPSKNKFETDFPELVSNIKPQNTNMDFKSVVMKEDEVPKDTTIKIKEGYVKLTKNGIIDSLTKEEREKEEEIKNIKDMNTNMINMYNHIEKLKQTRMAWDNNYVPEVVVDEYSSSEYFSSEESDEYAEDPEDEFNEL